MEEKLFLLCNISFIFSITSLILYFIGYIIYKRHQNKIRLAKIKRQQDYLIWRKNFYDNFIKIEKDWQKFVKEC